MLILIPLLLSLLQQPRIIDCIYDEKRVVAQCPKGYYEIDWSNEVFSEWLLVPAMRGGEVEFGGPIGRRHPQHGDILKIQLEDDGRWYAIASCKVRQVRAYQELKEPKLGDRISMPSEPDDCQPWYKKQ